ncbi:MAG: hypothetical protein C7K11_01920 [Candidatus Amulumruptor caecigallinarius]|nr:MAG: hypothetical protein C7K11_01920 [Candidatus Amulumruptor caecigallinarius]
MKLQLHPDYQHLEAFVRSIPSHGYAEEEVCWNRRNVVERVKTPDGQQDVIVKRFKAVGFFKGLIYTFFRKSKARRAYENALYLLCNGIDTAFPIAYIEERRMGVFRAGYFVSSYLPYATVIDMYMPERASDSERAEIQRGLVAFLVDLHSRGIVPQDFNMDNLFYHRDAESGELKFSLIDINRMATGRHTGTRDAMKALSQVGVNVWWLRDFVTYYHDLTGADCDECAYQILSFSRRRKRRKHFLKRL